MNFIRIWANISYFRECLMLERELERCHRDVCPCQMRVREQSMYQQPLILLGASLVMIPPSFFCTGQ